ncbi:MAG: hypothetical protein AAF487_11715 [Bacteroidota bacterium]
MESTPHKKSWIEKKIALLRETPLKELRSNILAVSVALTFLSLITFSMAIAQGFAMESFFQSIITFTPFIIFFIIVIPMWIFVISSWIYEKISK